MQTDSQETSKPKGRQPGNSTKNSPLDFDMDLEELEQIAIELNEKNRLGWQLKLSFLLSVAPSTINRWAKGQPIPTAHVRQIRTLYWLKKSSNDLFLTVLGASARKTQDIQGAPQFDNLIKLGQQNDHMKRTAQAKKLITKAQALMEEL